MTLGYGVIGGLFALLLPRQTFGWFLCNLFLFQFFSIVTIVPHELGHALVGRWVGFRVFKILVGMGKPVWTGKVFGFSTEIGVVPTGGFTFVAPKELTGYRRKAAAMVLAGPAVNLLLVLIILPAIDPANLWKWRAIDKEFSPSVMFFYANLWVLITNLLPYDFKHPLGKFATDGKLIIQLPFKKPEALSETHALYFAWEGAELTNQGRLNEANEIYDRGLAQYPKNMHLLSAKGIRHLYEGDFAKAREAFQQVLEQCSNIPGYRALMLNNIAYTNILAGDPELLDEADRFSTEALLILSSMPEVKGTRGSVLLARGRFDEAIPLLQYAADHVLSSRNKAENFSWLAIAEAGRGNHMAAQKFIAQARSFNPDSHALARAERALSNSSEMTKST